MKTKSLIMAFATLAFSTVAFAQEVNNKPAKDTSFASDPASSHWFFEIGDAATISCLPKVDGPKFMDRVSFINPYLALGKWHSPYFASRLKFMGGQYFQFTNPAVADFGKNKLTYVNATYDFMFDVVNYFATYREDRVFHLIPYLGVGVGYVGNVESNTENYQRNTFLPIVNGGLQFKFRLCKYADLNFDVATTASTETRPMGKDVPNQKYQLGLMSSLQAGLTFHLGNKEFTAVTPMDYALIEDLNSQVNKLRAENEELAKRPESCPECPEVNVKNLMVGNVVYFRINSAKIDKNQMINVYNTAQWAKNNTETITLVGYADKETGTPAYNMELSKRRAEAVKEVLVKKYGIAEDRIKVSWEGCEVQPYAENVWNRVVLMNSEVE